MTVEAQPIWYCDNLDLYKILCPIKIEGYEDNHYKKFKQGEVIYFESDQATSVYMVSKGKVKIAAYQEDGSEIVKAILTKGEVFGEMALLGEQKRTDFAIALSNDTAVCPMTLNKMHHLMRADNRFSTRIYKLIGLRFRKLERRLELILFKDSSTKLKEFIAEMSAEMGATVEGGISIKHPYTQNDIANLIGLRRETVNTLFQQFKDDGVLDYKRNRIEILSPEWLKN